MVPENIHTTPMEGIFQGRGESICLIFQGVGVCTIEKWHVREKLRKNTKIYHKNNYYRFICEDVKQVGGRGFSRASWLMLGSREP